MGFIGWGPCDGSRGFRAVWGFEGRDGIGGGSQTGWCMDFAVLFCLLPVGGGWCRRSRKIFVENPWFGDR